MTTARCKIVDVEVTRYYHCISRCVRGAYLIQGDLPGQDKKRRANRLERRKKWIEQRLELLVSSFAISVGGFVVMDNHLHVLVRLDPERAAGWTDEEVVRRWISICPPGGVDLKDPVNVQMWIDNYVKNKNEWQKFEKDWRTWAGL